MPSMKGYDSKHVNDRTKNPGKVKSGKVSADAYGPQLPLGTVTMARRSVSTFKGKKTGY